MTEEQLSLITAAVDGELSQAEQVLFRKLVEASAEARILFSRLKADRNRVRSLGQATPPATLLPCVMAKIAALTPPPGSLPAPIAASTRSTLLAQPARVAALPSRARYRPWVPVSIAASLLVAICGISFWFFTRSVDNAGAIARNSHRQRTPARGGAGESDWSKWLPFERGPQPVAPTPRTPTETDSLVSRTETQAVLVDSPSAAAVAIAPEPRTVFNPALMGAEVRPDIPPLDLVRVRVPFLRPLAEFDREETKSLLVGELNRDPAFRVDLFSRNLPRSVELLRAAAKSTGLTLHVDPVSLDRVNKGLSSAFVVYTESLTATELADLFAKLANEDARISPRVFDVLHAAAVVQGDQEAIRNILGIDPGLLKRAAQDKPRESGKSITEGTADQIVKSLTTSAGKSSEKIAVLMTWTPTLARTPPAASAELKQFLLKRGERKPNVVPALLVIRYRNG
jgi:hypothetical protein